MSYSLLSNEVFNVDGQQYNADIEIYYTIDEDGDLIHQFHKLEYVEDAEGNEIEDESLIEKLSQGFPSDLIQKLIQKDYDSQEDDRFNEYLKWEMDDRGRASGGYAFGE